MGSQGYLLELFGIKAQLDSTLPRPPHNRFIAGNVFPGTPFRVPDAVRYGGKVGIDAENTGMPARAIGILISREAGLVGRGLWKTFALKRSQNNRIGNHRCRKDSWTKPPVNPGAFWQVIRWRCPEDRRVRGEMRRKLFQ